jgi:hypothetical protein
MLRAYLDEKGFKTAMIDDNLAMLFRKSVAGVRAEAPEMTAESQRKVYEGRGTSSDRQMPRTV